MKKIIFLRFGNYLDLNQSESKFFEVLYYIYGTIIFIAILYIIGYVLGFLMAILEDFQFSRIFFN